MIYFTEQLKPLRRFHHIFSVTKYRCSGFINILSLFQSYFMITECVFIPHSDEFFDWICSKIKTMKIYELKNLFINILYKLVLRLNSLYWNVLVMWTLIHVLFVKLRCCVYIFTELAFLINPVLPIFTILDLMFIYFI